MSTSKKAMYALFLFSFIAQLQQMTNALIAYIISSYPAVDPTLVSSILTMPSLVGVFVCFAVGPIALKINKKILLLISGGCLFLYFAIFALVGSGGSINMLLIGAAFAGVSQGAAVTLIVSSINEFGDPKKNATNVAISNAIISAGAVVFNLAGGAIASANGGSNWPQAYYLGLIILPILIVFAIFMPKRPDMALNGEAAGNSHGEVDGNSLQKDKIPGKVILILLFNVLLTVSICTFMFNISKYIILENGLGTAVEAGLANSLFTLTGVVIGLTYSLWLKLFKKWIVPLGCVLVALSLVIMMTFNTNIIGAYLAAILIGFGFTFVNPSAMAKIMEVTPPRLVPVAMSIVIGAVNISMFGGLYILNFLSGLLGGGMTNTLLVGSIFAWCSAIFGIFIFSSEKSLKTETAV